jgi:hypothetical protein
MDIEDDPFDQPFCEVFDDRIEYDGVTVARRENGKWIALAADFEAWDEANGHVTMTYPSRWVPKMKLS